MSKFLSHAKSRESTHKHEGSQPCAIRIDDPKVQPLEKNRPTMLLAMLPAKLVLPNALPAKLDAWLNLSHLENARVFMTVKTNAMTMCLVSNSRYLFFFPLLLFPGCSLVLTDKR
jgi:hypothetical protein